MTDSYDLKDVMAEFKTALLPLQSLAESMRELDKSHRLQADLQLIEHCDSEHDRKKTFAKLDAAFNAETEALATLTLSRARSSDQRTFEQYAQAHGEANAKRAFTTDADVRSMQVAAAKEIDILRNAYPVHYRVFKQLRKG